jgi:hypothetical protein
MDRQKRSKKRWFGVLRFSFCLVCFFGAIAFSLEGAPWQVGIARRDITPDRPIWLQGYAGRDHPSERVDAPLLATAVALKDDGGARFVMVSVDNCGLSESFTQPVLQELETNLQFRPGEVMIISSHTHSGPVTEGPLATIFQLPADAKDEIHRYSQFLQRQLIAVVGEALADVQPAKLEFGSGRAMFAMNRRVYHGDKVDFGDNLDGPVLWEVPVLKISGTNNILRAILFGYACHGTSVVPEGHDGFTISPEYMGYARQYLETNYPGAIALYITGMSGDINPFPRKKLLEAKRHGLELAGAVAGVIGRPMRPVQGGLRMAYAEINLPLNIPSRAQLEFDAKSEDFAARRRAEKYLGWLQQGQALPEFQKLPMAAIGMGRDLTFLAMGGEPVIDYAIKFKRVYGADNPWLIGYAYNVPCYIPSSRILKEGGYEADYNLVLYGIYGPFKPSVEDLITRQAETLMAHTRIP